MRASMVGGDGEDDDWYSREDEGGVKVRDSLCEP